MSDEFGPPEGQAVRMWWVLPLVLALTGCGTPNGPASTDMASDALPSLSDRVEFLERYVTFRRIYRDLGFRVTYRNNGGGLVPGPSEWDIRLVAVVPPAELAVWVPPGLPASPSADRQWLEGVPGAEWAGEIREWYVLPGKVVGIDRARSVVAYSVWHY